MRHKLHKLAQIEAEVGRRRKRRRCLKLLLSIRDFIRLALQMLFVLFAPTRATVNLLAIVGLNCSVFLIIFR